MVAQIKKRHLFCCCICGFILGVVAVIGTIAAVLYYCGMMLSDVQFNTKNGRPSSSSLFVITSRI